jgi:integrase
VFAGPDPVTGKERYLAETIKGTDRAAYRLAARALTKLRALVRPLGARTAGQQVKQWISGSD